MDVLLAVAMKAAENLGFDLRRPVTLLGVTGLANEEWLVEVEATAVLRRAASGPLAGACVLASCATWKSQVVCAVGAHLWQTRLERSATVRRRHNSGFGDSIRCRLRTASFVAQATGLDCELTLSRKNPVVPLEPKRALRLPKSCRSTSG